MGLEGEPGGGYTVDLNLKRWLWLWSGEWMGVGGGEAEYYCHRLEMMMAGRGYNRRLRQAESRALWEVKDMAASHILSL